MSVFLQLCFLSRLPFVISEPWGAAARPLKFYPQLQRDHPGPGLGKGAISGQAVELVLKS